MPRRGHTKGQTPTMPTFPRRFRPFTRHIFAFLFLSILVASCGGSAIDPAWQRKMAAYEAFQAVCHNPPYTGPTETDPLPEGMQYIPCGDGYQFVVAWGNAREKGLGAVSSFVEHHGKDLHEKLNISSIGMGLCCDSDKAPPETRSYWCGRVEIVACSMTLPEFARAITEMRTADGVDAAPVAFSIRVDGVRNEGPRCRADDPKCGPSKPHQAKPYNPKLPRNVVDFHGRGSCTHDGDCYPVGCEHEDCWAWQLGQRFGTCFDTPRGPPISIYCGCIEGQCELFQQ